MLQGVFAVAESVWNTAVTGLKALFDTSFRNFITREVLRIVYVLAILWAFWQGITTIGMLRASMHGFWAFVLGIGYFLLLVMTARVALEIVMVIFRIAENTTILADHAQRGFLTQGVSASHSEPTPVVTEPEPEEPKTVVFHGAGILDKAGDLSE